MEAQQKLHDWFMPLSCADKTLREVSASLREIGLKQGDIPYLVRFVENPQFDLPKDEAFVIGFSMGSTGKVSTTEEFLYGLFAKHLYPRAYRFTEEDFCVFKDAVRLGFISDCRSLCETHFAPYLDLSLGEVRGA